MEKWGAGQRVSGIFHVGPKLGVQVYLAVKPHMDLDLGDLELENSQAIPMNCSWGLAESILPARPLAMVYIHMPGLDSTPNPRILVVEAAN